MTRSSKKPEEKVLERVEETFKRYIGILSEDFQSKLSVVGERVGSLDGHVGSLSEHVGSLAEQLGVVTEKVDVMGGDIKEIKVDIVSIKNALGRKVEYDEFAGLERRVTRLEAGQ